MLARVAEALPLGGDVDGAPARALAGDRPEGRVEHGEEGVVVGGVRIPRWREATHFLFVLRMDVRGVPDVDGHCQARLRDATGHLPLGLAQSRPGGRAGFRLPVHEARQLDDEEGEVPPLRSACASRQ